MNLDQQTRNIIKFIEAKGYAGEVTRVTGHITITATTVDGDEEFGMAATLASAIARHSGSRF